MNSTQLRRLYCPGVSGGYFTKRRRIVLDESWRSIPCSPQAVETNPEPGDNGDEHENNNEDTKVWQATKPEHVDEAGEQNHRRNLT